MNRKLVSSTLGVLLLGVTMLSACAGSVDKAQVDAKPADINDAKVKQEEVSKSVLSTLLKESAGAEYDQAVAAIEASALDFATSPGSQAKLAAVYAGADLADFTLDNAEGDSFVFFSVCSDVDGTITVNDQNVPCGIENGGRHEWAAAYGGESKVAHKVTTYKAADGKLFVVKVTGK